MFYIHVHVHVHVDPALVHWTCIQYHITRVVANRPIHSLVNMATTMPTATCVQ